MELEISLHCLQVSLLVITLSQLNPVHAYPKSFFKTNFIIILLCLGVPSRRLLHISQKRLCVLFHSHTRGTCH